MSTPAAAPATTVSFQDAFVKAAVNRVIMYSIGDAERDNQKELVISRWTLTQNMQLSHALALFTQHFNDALAGIAKVALKGADGTIEVSAKQLIEENGGAPQITEVFAKYGSLMLHVIAGTIQPHNGFKSLEEAKAYVETLDVSEALELFFLIVRHNAATEVSKKKFAAIAEATASLSR